jgi:hypothetical protein
MKEDSMSYFINPAEDDRCLSVSYEGEMPPVELSAARYEANGVLDQRHWDRMVVERLSQNPWTALPVTRWESAQFSPAVNRKRGGTISVAPRCLRRISEAHVSAREAAFGRRISLFDRIRRSRAGVRFRTAIRSQADTW